MDQMYTDLVLYSFLARPSAYPGHSSAFLSIFSVRYCKIKAKADPVHVQEAT